MKPCRILIADDHDLVRLGAKTLIEKHEGWIVCGEAANGREAVSLAERLRPDIVLMDIEMPELNGLDATRQIKRLLPDTEVLIFTGNESEEMVHNLFEAGARSYIFKTESKTNLIPAIESLLQHKPFLASKIAEIVFKHYQKKDTRSNGQAGGEDLLTAREREVIQLLAEGKSNKEVASTLGISAKTVETHRAAVMRKLKLDAFSDLVRYAIRNEIIKA